MSIKIIKFLTLLKKCCSLQFVILHYRSMVGNTAGDYFIGSVLLAIMYTGVTANILALLYFTTRRTRNANSKFFRKVYIIIIIVDMVICLSMAPVIEAAFSPNRLGVMFSNHEFCNTWGILWVIFPNMSVFMIAMLSISRFLVLKQSTTQLNKRMAWLLPLIFLVILLILLLVTFQAKITEMTFRPEFFICGPKGFATNGKNDDKGVVNRGLVSVILFTVLPGLTVIPVSLSCIFSLVYLNRAKLSSRSIGSCARRHYHAACTVLIVTLVYIIFNLPFSFSALLFVLKLLKLRESLGKGEESEDSKSSLLEEFSQQNPAFNYITVVVFVICIAGNSLANPFVYLARMGNFRMYIRHLMGDQRASVINSL